MFISPIMDINLIILLFNPKHVKLAQCNLVLFNGVFTVSIHSDWNSTCKLSYKSCTHFKKLHSVVTCILLLCY